MRHCVFCVLDDRGIATSVCILGWKSMRGSEQEKGSWAEARNMDLNDRRGFGQTQGTAECVWKLTVHVGMR